MRLTELYELGVADERVFRGEAIDDIRGFPSFDLQIPGALLHFPPQLYFLRQEGGFTLQIVQNEYAVEAEGWMESRIRCKWDSQR